MFDEVGPQFAHKLVQEDGWTYVDGETNRITGFGLVNGHRSLLVFRQNSKNLAQTLYVT